RLQRGTKLVEKRYDLKIRYLDKSKMKEEVALIKSIYNEAWEDNWGFVPLTDKEIEAMADELKPLAVKELIVFAEVNGECVGFGLAMPDYNAIIKKMNGNLFPFNFLRFFLQKKAMKFARVITLGLRPKWQKKGIDAVIYRELVKGAKIHNLPFGEASWILENNVMMNRGLVSMGGEVYKKYHVYIKEI
ncbi:hypothetical protein N8482_03560, partial [Chitinophagales bacterium]|nr:hypothetical protein [Chitinophagales bacterium]